MTSSNFVGCSTGRSAGLAPFKTLSKYLTAHACRLYATVTDAARVAAALLATKITRRGLGSPFTARDVYRNERTGLTEPRVLQGRPRDLEELAWVWPETVRGPGGRAAHGAVPYQPAARWGSDCDARDHEVAPAAFRLA
jgi:hypothetical protein